MMSVYVAMLRGINIGHKRIKMDALRNSFTAIGFDAVQTYIQSGNVVFKAGKGSPATLSQKIEKRLLLDFGFAVPVTSRSQDELRDAISRNPFLEDKKIDESKLHVTFLSQAPETSALKKVEALTTAPDRLCCVGEHIYLYFPNGFSQSSLFRSPWERLLSVVTTTRNWRTVNALYQMCLDCK
jgi:uncharacterized protein (DUF1697 family)